MDHQMRREKYDFSLSNNETFMPAYFSFLIEWPLFLEKMTTGGPS